LGKANDVVNKARDAQRVEGEEPVSGFSFKFFVQTTKFLPLVLEKVSPESRVAYHHQV
jgi:hypothetical protein